MIGSCTPLNTSREMILTKCVNKEFNEVVVRNPYPIKESARNDKSKYACFYKSIVHKKNDCIQLKVAIDRLIKKGDYLRTQRMIRYTEMIIQKKSPKKIVEDVVVDKNEQ